MRILIFILTLISFDALAQISPKQIKGHVPPDDCYVLLTDTLNGLTFWQECDSVLVGGGRLDTAYIDEDGDLVIISIEGDTTTFSGGTGDEDWYKLGTTLAPNNTDTMFHIGPTVFGSDTMLWYGNARVGIEGRGTHSCLDLSIDNVTYSMRVKHDLFDCPLMYIDGRGAIYTASQVVISAAHENSEYGCQLKHPSLDQFMFGINSDVGGPGIQIKQSAAEGSHQIESIDKFDDYRWMLEADGTMRWGLDSIQDMDTDFFRSDSAKLFTNGAFGVGWTLPTPTHIAGLTASGYLSKIFLGPGIEFVNDTLYNTGQDDDWYKSGGLTPDDNTQDIYHEGDIHVGTNTLTSDAELNVIGRANVLQSLSVNNIFINGGNYTASGTGNIAIGNDAGIDLTTGQSNSFFGTFSGTNATTGNRNLGNGYQSLLSLTTGSDNFGLGNDALRSVTTQNNNVAIGASALYSMTAGDNVGIGRQAGYSNTSADNVFIGMEAGGGSSGEKNTIIGRYAGYGSTGRNINIGYGAGYSNTTASRLFISSYNWANATEDYEYSIISGLMDATASNQILNLNAKVLPRYMGGTSTGIAGYDATGYLSTVGTGWGIDLTSGNLVVDSSQVATQYDLTTVTGSADGNGLFDAANEGGTIAVITAEVPNDGLFFQSATNASNFWGYTPTQGTISNLSNAGDDMIELNNSHATFGTWIDFQSDVSFRAGVSKSADQFQITQGSVEPFVIEGTPTVDNSLQIQNDGDLLFADYPPSRDDGTPTAIFGAGTGGRVELYPLADVQDGDDQTLTIDSSGASAPRTITIGISGGNDVTFLDLDTGGGGGMTSWLFAASGTGGTEAITDGETATITGAGINVATRSGSNVTITGTEVDGSTTNEAWTIDGDAGDTEVISNQTVLFDGTGAATTTYTSGTNTLTIDVSTEAIQDAVGPMVDPGNTETGITVTYDDAGNMFDFVVTDASTTNELQTLSNNQNATAPTVTLSNSGGSFQLAEGGGIDIVSSGTALNSVMTLFAADESETNELQTLSASGTTTTYGLNLSDGGGTINLIEGTGITIDRTSNNLTINSSGGSSDADWFEVGGTTPPDAITDDIYHTGDVMIGASTAPETGVQLHIQTNGEGVLLEELSNTALITTRSSSDGTNHPFQLQVMNEDAHIDISGDAYPMGAIRFDKNSATVAGGTIEFHVGYDSLSMDQVLTVNSRATGATDGYVGIVGGLRYKWAATANTSITVTLGDYGVTSTAAGTKTYTLPDAVSGIVGQFFMIFNSGAGTGTVAIAGGSGDTIYGDVSVLQNESIQVHCPAANVWVITN